jgi:NADPH-dependent curcumin reductase CurA
VVGVNYFDMKRDCACNAENLILYGDGDAVVRENVGGEVCQAVLPLLNNFADEPLFSMPAIGGRG